MQAFSLSVQFACENTMLRLPEERRRWGESKGAARGRGERGEKYFFLPSPSPLSFFRLRTYRKGYYFYSPQSFIVIKSKMAAATTLPTRTRFRPPKIRLHCRLINLDNQKGFKVNIIHNDTTTETALRVLQRNRKLLCC